MRLFYESWQSVFCKRFKSFIGNERFKARAASELAAAMAKRGAFGCEERRRAEWAESAFLAMLARSAWESILRKLGKKIISMWTKPLLLSAI
jgi:hypothetical protein